MTDQTELFQPAHGRGGITEVPKSYAEEIKEEAIDRVEKNADSAWKRAAMESIRQVASKNPHFTTDDVWVILDQYNELTHEPRALGALMRKAIKRGWCISSGVYRPSNRVENHRRPIPGYRSLICHEA